LAQASTVTPRASVAGMPRVLVVEPESGCPVDRLGGWLSDAGVELRTCRPYDGDAVPGGLEDDGLIVLGGHMGAYDDADHPWLGPVRDLLARSVGEAAPVLGICLGAQLLVAACGGRVEVGAGGIEAGVVDVRWRPEAASDPLVAGLPSPFPGPSMHLDAVVELPPDAVWLGETAAYPHQVFRVGASAWGVQFHPEVSLSTYRTWAGHHEKDWPRWGIDGAAVVQQLARAQADVATAGRALAVSFAGRLG